MFSSYSFAKNQGIIIKTVDDNTLLVIEDGVTNYVTQGFDSNGNSISKVYDDRFNLIQSFEVNFYDNTMTIEDSSGEKIFENLDDESNEMLYERELRATEFCNVLGKTKGWYTVKIPWTSIITASGVFVGAASLLGAIAARVGSTLTLSNKIIGIVNSSIGLGITAAGVVKTSGGIQFSGPKKCTRKRGGENWYNTYSFSAQQASVY